VRPLLVALATVLLAGCVTYGAQFAPAPGTQEVPGSKFTGVTTEEGVTVAVSGKRWSGDPSSLGALVTPMRVTITNNSGQPVRIDHHMFALELSTGMKMQAVSPFEIQRPGAVSYGPYGGYWGGPWGGWPGAWGWYGPWGYGGGYWGPWYDWEPLPSRDMVQKALPEGVLAEGGTAIGYVFFPYVSGSVGQLQFTAQVISAKTNEPIAQIELPFVAQG